MNKKPTIRDIAEICGCSANTVSGFCGEHPDLPGPSGKDCPGRKGDWIYSQQSGGEHADGLNKTIAVIFQDFRNPFLQFLPGLSRNMPGRWDILCCLLLPANRRNRRWRPAGRYWEGMWTAFSSPHPAGYRGGQTAYGAKDAFCPFGAEIPGVDAYSVIADDEQGAYLTTRHLLERGAREILFLNSFSFICTSQFREQGYLRALKEYGSQPHILEVSMEYGKTRKP